MYINNKLIWIFRYFLFLLFISISKKYQKCYTIYRRYIPKHRTSKASKQEELPQPTATIPSRKKGFSVYFDPDGAAPISFLEWQMEPLKQWFSDKGGEVTSNPHEAGIIVIGHRGAIKNPAAATRWQP